MLVLVFPRDMWETEAWVSNVMSLMLAWALSDLSDTKIMNQNDPREGYNRRKNVYLLGGMAE